MWVQSLGQEDPPRGGNGNPIQYSCMKNPMDRGAWWAAIQRVAESNRTEQQNSKLRYSNSSWGSLLFFFFFPTYNML